MCGRGRVLTRSFIAVWKYNSVYSYSVGIWSLSNYGADWIILIIIKYGYIQVKPLCDLHVHVLISPCDLGASVKDVDKEHGSIDL